MKTRTKKGRTLLTPEQRADQERDTIQDFNHRFPVGKKIWFWKTLPFGPVIETTIREEAYIADSGHCVCLLQGISGYVSIWHIQPIDESRRADLAFGEANWQP